jgi:hypothetical protein
MASNAPRITDPRFLFFSYEDFAGSEGAKLQIGLDYRYLSARDLAQLLLERVGLETFNVSEALDTIEDNLEVLNGGFVTISHFNLIDISKANDIIGMIQIIAYVIFRSGGTIRFYLESGE